MQSVCGLFRKLHCSKFADDAQMLPGGRRPLHVFDSQLSDRYGHVSL